MNKLDKKTIQVLEQIKSDYSESSPLHRSATQALEAEYPEPHLRALREHFHGESDHHSALGKALGEGE